MNILIGTLCLWLGVLWLWRKLPDQTARHAAIRGALDLARFTLPRMAIALVGAAFFAELVPAGQIEALFGPASGLRGILLATLLGPLTPGGAFVSFAIAAAALNVGATYAATIAYMTAWGLFSLTKALAYEIPLMGPRRTFWRMAFSWPVPILAGLGAWSLT